MRKFMKQEKYLKLKNILLDAITDDLSNTINGATTLTPLAKEMGFDLSDKEKFEFAYNRYKTEVGDFQSVESWLLGLALPVPHYYVDIEEQGFNSVTYWRDLSRVLIRENETMFSPSGHNDLDIYC